MSRRSRSLERLPSPSQDDLTIMDRLANALDKLSNAQTSNTRRDTFKAPDFNGKEDVETFILHFQEVADANQWSPTSALLHIRTHLQDDARGCGNYPTLEEVFRALRSKYGLSTREARTRLTNLRRDTKLSLEEHATEVKKLVGLAYADLPSYHQEAMTMDLFCNSLNHAYLQRHLLAIKPESLKEAVEAGSEFLQIKPTSTYGANVRQVDENELPDQVQAAQAKPSEMELLLQALRQLTTEVEGLKKTHKTSTDRKKKGVCWKCGQEGHLQRDCPVSKAAGNE